MLKAMRVSAMLLALVGTTYAGEVLTPPAPQPPQANATKEPTSGGTATDETPAGTADVLTQIALDVFAVLPSLL
jgi:hypothetical protein